MRLAGVVERHQPLAPALAADDKHALVAPRRRLRQRHQLGDAQARGVEHLQQAVQPRRAQPLRRRLDLRAGARLRQQIVDLLDAENLGQAAAALRPLDHRGRIVAAMAFAVEETIELADRGEPPRHRRRRKPALGKPPEMSAQRVAIGCCDRLPGIGEVGGEIGEIAPVGIERVDASAALGRDHVEEQLDQRFVAGARPSAHPVISGKA